MTESRATEKIASWFPRLSEHGFNVTSPPTPKYNCIAWAAGDSNHWWWPGVGGYPIGGYYWPTMNVQTTPDTCERAFATLGYVRCENGDYESGFEKIAVYAGPSGQLTHAARQLEDGTWVSKLGKAEDIIHADAEGVCGNAYGEIAFFMRREKNGSKEG